jgi:hypothetical protein
VQGATFGSAALQENEPAREMFLVSSGTVQVRAFCADTLARLISSTFLLPSEAFPRRHDDAGAAIAASMHPVVSHCCRCLTFRRNT